MKPITSVGSKIIFTVFLAFSMNSCNEGFYSREKKMKRVLLPANEVHQGWYFAAGDQVVIEGTINGDAYVAGGFVEVDGTINGDLLVAGGMVTVGGTVSDDIRAVGGTLQFNGKVGKNVSAAGGSVTIAKSAAINGSVLAACGNLEVVGTISRGAKIAAGDAGVSGTIKGNVDFAGGRFTALPGAKIGGNIEARVREKEHVEITEGTVLGTVKILTAERGQIRRILGYHAWRFWSKILWACSLLLTGLALIFVFPKQLIGIGSTIGHRPGTTLLWGIGGLILIPISFGVLFITIIGIPLGLLLLAIFLWLCYLSQLSLGVLVGHRLLGTEKKKGWNLFWGFAVGVLIVQALTFIPYVRFLVVVAGLVFGIGAILLVLKSEVRLRPAK